MQFLGVLKRQNVGLVLECIGVLHHNADPMAFRPLSMGGGDRNTATLRIFFQQLKQQTENQVEVRNFQGIYLSPQQAKALAAILQQNVTNYEGTFGEIKLDPRVTAPGPVH